MLTIFLNTLREDQDSRLNRKNPAVQSALKN